MSEAENNDTNPNDPTQPVVPSSPSGNTPPLEDKGISPPDTSLVPATPPETNGTNGSTPPIKTGPVRVPRKAPPSNDPISKFRNKQVEEDDEGRMGFIDHLLELRKRMWISIIAIALCVLVALIFYEQVYAFLLRPIRWVDDDMVRKAIENGHPPADRHFIHITTTEPLGTMMTVIWLGFWAGLVVASPIVILQLWGFIAPGLHAKEKNAIKPVLYGGVFFFLAGAAIAYFVLAPLTFNFFLWLDLRLEVTPNWTSEKCIEMLITMMIVCGMLCEIPLLVAGLARLGIIEPQWLIKYWKVLTFGSVLLGMIVSPGNDLVSMAAFSGLILGIYLVSIIMAYVFYKKPVDPYAKAATASNSIKDDLKEAMIKGVSKPAEIAHLGLSNRLLARIGALLKKKLSVTLAALEAAKPNSALEALLLRADLLQDAATIDTARLEAFAKDSGVDANLSIAEDDDARTICLEDELVSADEWSGASAQPLSTIPAGNVAIRPSVEPNAQAPNELFGDDHLTRTRLKLMTSAHAADRIEALRILVFSPLIPTDKAEIILQALSDPDETVRAEAATLLPGLGVGTDIAAALADLNKGDLAKRIAAAEKLAKIAAVPSHDLADGAVIVCAMSVLKGTVERTLKLKLLDLLINRADTVGRNAARLSELIRVIAGLIAAANKLGPSSRDLDDLIGVSQRLVKEVGRRHPESLLEILKAERERAADFAVESFLIVALFDLVLPGHADETNLLDWSAAYLARDTEEGRGSRAVGALISRRGNAALLKLCEVFSDATPGAQKHLLILLDEMCRRTDVSPEGFARASGIVLTAMESGSKSLRMAAMECRLVCDLRVPSETRRLLAEAFLDSTRDFSFSFDIDKAESTVERMGAPAVVPLLARLGRDRAPNERARAARLLGELALHAKPEPNAAGFSMLQKALTDALRRLESASLDTEFPDRGEVFSALGKIISSPAAAIEANAIVERTLLDAAAGKDPKLAPRALEGAAYMASSRRAKPELVAETLTLLKSALDAPEPEQFEKTSKDANGDTVFEIEGGERYAVDLPIALSGLERIALAQNTQTSITREIGAFLLQRWKEICTGERVWGPGNSSTVNQALRSIALSENCGAELRLEIVKGLLARLNQTPTMNAITEILAADDTRASSGIALNVGFGILGRHDPEGRFSELDRGDILLALARLAGRKILLAPPAEVERTPEAFRRSVVNELIKGAKDDVPGAAKALETLSKNEALSLEMRTEIERRIRTRRELVRR